MARRSRRRRWLRRRVRGRATGVTASGRRSSGRWLGLGWWLHLLRWWLGLWWWRRLLRWWFRLLLSRRRLLRYGLHTLWRRWRFSRRRSHLLRCRWRLYRYRRRVRRRDFSGGDRSDDQGKHGGDDVTLARRLPPCRRGSDAALGLSDGLRCDGHDLALIVGTVGLHGRVDESVYGCRDAAGGIEAGERVLVIPIVSNQIHQVAHRHAAIEFAANFMGCVDEARHVVDGRDVLVTEQRQKLVILARVGRCRAGGQNCDADNYRGGGNQVASLADEAGQHGRASVLLKPSPDVLWVAV